MKVSAALPDVLAALSEAFPVNPWLGALWLASAIALAAALVYVWHRLASRLL